MNELFKLVSKIFKWVIIFCIAVIVFFAIFLDIATSLLSDEEKKERLNIKYMQIKSIPASEPCKNLEGYKNLEDTEIEYKTSYYSEITSQKIEKYKPLCHIKKKEIAEEARRLEEAKKVGDWKKGYFVDDFGDRTNSGFIFQTTKGLFSNVATENSLLRVRMYISNANLENQTPWFRLYEYDGANPIKGFYRKNLMECRVRDQHGLTFKIDFFQSEGSDHFNIKGKKESIEVLKYLIKSGGVGKFACENIRSANEKYAFSFNFKYFNNIVTQFNEGS